MDDIRENLYISNMVRPDSPPAIRSYNLFGETSELPDVVHCEHISTRSRLHNWELQPHRHARLHQVLLLKSGGGTALIEERQVTLCAGDVLNIPRGLVHGFRFQENSRGWVVTLTSDLVDQTLPDSEGLRPRIGRFGMTRASDDLEILVRRIFAEYGGRKFARAQALRSLAGVLLALLARRLETATDAGDTGRVAPVVRRFETLIDAHFADGWRVADYAAALSVSPTHLARLVRQAMGQPPGQVLAERILREARRLLTFTNLPVAQIGYALGYSDPAYFSRVFTRGAGLSPRAFRERIEGRAAGGIPPAPEA